MNEAPRQGNGIKEANTERVGSSGCDVGSWILRGAVIAGAIYLLLEILFLAWMRSLLG